MEIKWHLHMPAIEDAARELSEMLRLRAWIFLLGYCMVEYEGRGASKSTPGDRLITVKPDGSVIIHGPHGFKPLNWQPNTSSVTVSREDDSLVIRAVRNKPREVVVARCSRVYEVIGAVGPEEGNYWMYLNEAEIRDLIASDPSIIEDGMRTISIEKRVEPGFIDLYLEDKDGNLVVVEIKRVKAGEDAARQLHAYIDSVRRSVRRNVRGILVAPAATEQALLYLHKAGLEFKKIDLAGLYKRIADQKRKRRSLMDFV